MREQISPNFARHPLGSLAQECLLMLVKRRNWRIRSASLRCLPGKTTLLHMYKVCGATPVDYMVDNVD